MEGSAAVVIQSIEFCASNYAVAWGLLCERFDNKRLLIQNHISALFNLESINKESSVALKRMLDHINKNLRALQSLGEPISTWDTLLIYILSHKLDTKTFREWEEHKGGIDKSKPITFNQFMEFIRNRADLIETLELSRNTASLSQVHITQKAVPKIRAMVTINNSHSGLSCPKCNGDHKLNLCPQFLALTVRERLLCLPNYKVCYNCFSNAHFANKCRKNGCKVCKRRHHSLIHDSDIKPRQSADQSDSDNDVKVKCSSNAPGDKQQVALSANIVPGAHASNPCNVLLSTALVKLGDSQHVARALLDSGSSSCLITEKLYKKLNVSYTEVNKSIQGINNLLSHVNKMCKIHLKSLNDSYSTNVECFVLPTITDNVPAQSVNLCDFTIPSHINLADPNFHEPAEIDMIIGADLFWDLLESGKISLGQGKPTLCQTKLGWLVCGSLHHVRHKGGCASASATPIKCNFLDVSSSHDIQTQLAQFWQLEEVGCQSSVYSEEEKQCEQHFIKNTSRSSDGRFCVQIPLKESSEVLGESFERAKRCFLSLEKRNQKQSTFDMMYKNFMSEYLDLGHMTECHLNVDNDNKSYFIPHHGVLREVSTTTKLRVVFNASYPTTSGLSFNNIQLVGPTVQDDLMSILLRFRFFKYVLSADVEKMYRQVSVHPSDRHLQQIIWRDTPSSSLKTYQLNTVTYGTASAPFLATRCLKQIGLECKNEKVAEVILHDFYVDDLLTGTNDFDEAVMLRENVTAELASACMPLRKWRSNEPALLSDKSSQTPLDLNIGGTEPSKTLGLKFSTGKLILMSYAFL